MGEAAQVLVSHLSAPLSMCDQVYPFVSSNIFVENCITLSLAQLEPLFVTMHHIFRCNNISW